MRVYSSQQKILLLFWIFGFTPWSLWILDSDWLQGVRACVGSGESQEQQRNSCFYTTETTMKQGVSLDVYQNLYGKAFPSNPLSVPSLLLFYDICSVCIHYYIISMFVLYRRCIYIDLIENMRYSLTKSVYFSIKTISMLVSHINDWETTIPFFPLLNIYFSNILLIRNQYKTDIKRQNMRVFTTYVVTDFHGCCFVVLLTASNFTNSLKYYS